MRENFLKASFSYVLLTFLVLSINIRGITLASPTPQLRIEPNKTEYWTPALNEVFKVNASITDVSKLQGFELKLRWNTTHLDLIKADIQPFLNPPTSILKNETNEELGVYWLSIASIGPPKTGSGTLVTFFFKITYEPVWPKNITSILNLTETKLSEPEGATIYHEVYDGEYSCYSTAPLNITIMTDKPSHWLAEPTHIYGNLTYGYSQVQNGTVALEVDKPDGEVIIVRSLQTDVPPTNPLVEILSVVPCSDQWGTIPKYNFQRGKIAYFNTTARNNGNETIPLRLVINVFDSNLRPIGVSTFARSAFIGVSSWVANFFIPTEAAVGDAVVYASALTSWPKLGGTAYCPEKSETFQIEESGGTKPVEFELPNVNYNLTFNLLLKEGGGTYSVYATSYFKGQTATNNMSLEIDLPDVNGDGLVDIFDLVAVALAYGSKPNDPNWNSNADLNDDGLVDIFDLVIVSAHYGAEYYP